MRQIDNEAIPIGGGDPLRVGAAEGERRLAAAIGYFDPGHRRQHIPADHGSLGSWGPPPGEMV
jgi:hypothetical protein